MSSGEEFTDYYQLLGVELDADNATLKKAYFMQAKTAHPDAGGSTEAMQQLAKAYKILSDPIKRGAYNKLYTLHTNVATSDLDLKEDDYDVPETQETVDSGYEDFFVDQLYSEYYTPKKKSGWNPFKRK